MANHNHEFNRTETKTHEKKVQQPDGTWKRVCWNEYIEVCACGAAGNRSTGYEYDC